MKRYIEYGILAAAIFTLVYLAVSFFTGVNISIIAILLCIGGGALSGALVAGLLIFFSPGEVIPEGEEDNYIKNH